MAIPVRFVLFETSHPGNIGAAARAMKTMGFAELVLVNPQKFPHGDARAMSSGALDVLNNARVVSSLSEAVDGCVLVVGASARRRALRCPELSPRECAVELRDQSQHGPVAVLFGQEQSGLANSELDQCNALVYIPANPDYSSLNLAMAVQLIAYELRMAGAPVVPELPPESPPASFADMELFFAHLEQVLLDSGFLNPANPRQLMRRLTRFFKRAHPDQNELNILRGILSAVAPGSGDRAVAEKKSQPK